MSQLIEITASSGLTGLVGKLFADGSDTVAATSSAVAEATNRKSIYTATFTGVTVDTYQLLLLDGDGLPVASRIVRVTATSGTFTELAMEPPTLAEIEDVVGEGGGGGAGTNGTGQHKITVTVQRSTDAQKVNNVRVDIVGTTTHDYTDTNGVAELNVGPNATYTLRITAPGGFEAYADFPQPVVESDVTKLVELVPTTVELAASPYCNVTLPAISQFTEEAAGIPCEFDFLAFLPGATRTAIVLNLPPDLVTGTDGTITVRLARLARYQVTYKIPFATFKIEPKVVKFSTPDAGSYAVVEPV